MGYISLPLILNAMIGITSYYCVILKIVILHDGIKTIQNGIFLFSLKKEQNLVSFLKNPKKQVGFYLTRVFLNPAYSGCSVVPSVTRSRTIVLIKCPLSCSSALNAGIKSSMSVFISVHCAHHMCLCSMDLCLVQT